MNTPAGGWRRNLPWIDAGAGLTLGVFVMALREVLSRLYTLPLEVLTFTAFANLLYPMLGFSIGWLSPRVTTARRVLLYLLVVANLAWSLVCVWLLLRYRLSASVWGVGHLVGEAGFVATLAVLEWRHRGSILCTT